MVKKLFFLVYCILLHPWIPKSQEIGLVLKSVTKILKEMLRQQIKRKDHLFQDIE